MSAPLVLDAAAVEMPSQVAPDNPRAASGPPTVLARYGANTKLTTIVEYADEPQSHIAQDTTVRRGVRESPCRSAEPGGARGRSASTSLRCWVTRGPYPRPVGRCARHGYDAVA